MTKSLAILLALASTAHAQPSIDVNGDGEFTSNDVDTICQSVNWNAYEGDQQHLIDLFDFDQSGRFGAADFGAFLAIANVPQGDFNFDGAFNEQDIVHLFAQPRADKIYRDPNGIGGHLWSMGDANCNDNFTEEDFVTMFSAGTYQGGAAAVPEPSTAAILLAGLATLALSHRRS